VVRKYDLTKLKMLADAGYPNGNKTLHFHFAKTFHDPASGA
jgi:hypothetical protein